MWVVKNNSNSLRLLPLMLIAFYFLVIKKMNLVFELELGYLILTILISVSVLYFLFKNGLIAKQKLVMLLSFVVLSVCIGGYFYFRN